MKNVSNLPPPFKRFNIWLKSSIFGYGGGGSTFAKRSFVFNADSISKFGFGKKNSINIWNDKFFLKLKVTHVS